MDIQAILIGEVTEYNFSTTEPMDNYWSMDRFIKDFDLEHRITLHDGTYIEIEGVVGAHSGGNGDFHSHKIRFEIL